MPDWVQAWPLVNIGIIAVHILVLFYGLFLIKVKKDVISHKKTMITAGVVFLVFLASFITRIIIRGQSAMGTWDFFVQPAHLQGLHAGIALVTVIVVGITYWLGLTNRFDRHKRIARWAFGLWVFTGVFGIVGHFLYPRL